jgi:hypothetical protein
MNAIDKKGGVCKRNIEGNRRDFEPHMHTRKEEIKESLDSKGRILTVYEPNNR